MELMDMARALGIRAREEEAVKRLEKAKSEYLKSDSLREAFYEYETQQKILEMQNDAEKLDEVFISKIDARINELYEKITKDPLFIEYESAQNEVNKLENDIMAQIMAQISGDDSGCTHDCSTCRGCSSALNQTEQ